MSAWVVAGLDRTVVGGLELPCWEDHHQLRCSGPGTAYPAAQISRYIKDNRALLRRMSGAQVGRKPRAAPATVRIVRT